MPVFIHVAVQCDECQRAATGLCELGVHGMKAPVLKEKGWKLPKDGDPQKSAVLCPDHAPSTIIGAGS